MAGIRALVVEPDPVLRERIRQGLERHGFLSHSAANSAAAQDAIRREAFDVLFVDPEFSPLPEPGSLEIPIKVALTEHVPSEGTEWHDRSCEDPKKLQLLARRLTERFELATREREGRERLARGLGLRGVVGLSRSSERLRTLIGELASGELPLWVSGADGVGKQHAIRTLHEISPSTSGPLVILAAENLAEYPWSESTEDPQGLRQRVASGSLVVEGFDRLPEEAQARFVEAWEKGWFHDPESHAPCCRLCIVTRESPERLVAEGRVIAKAPLRLAVAHAHIPRLRNRSEDIPRLVDYFLREIVEINRLSVLKISPAALKALGNHDWPENVRELRACVEHAAILAVDGLLDVGDLPEKIRTARSGTEGSTDAATLAFREAKNEIVSRFERGYLTSLLRGHKGNVTAAAQRAGMLRSALQRLLRKHGLRSAEFRPRRRSVPAMPNEVGREEI